ncbi:glutathione hydrolase 5 proenzyme-like [Pristis pectinata]|uniref:glutathione hydrolase 5 proenzyme-like n=1 Tax=Pristis pectinata TaxID=685728 RepID=UPI00223E269E|nr:glutathione hydrolase 5 proenzyme-like [Pristis pectinata]
MRTDMKRWKGCCWLLLLLLLGLLVTVGVLLFLARVPRCSRDAPYSHAAVAADSHTCSQVGRGILQKGGSAVDAAIAALLCSSLVQPQSLGIGGGAIHTIYHAATGRVVVINAREGRSEEYAPGLPASMMSPERLQDVLKGEGEQPEVAVHIGINDTGRERGMHLPGNKLAEQCNITEEDFRQYKVRVMQPQSISLRDYTMYTPPWPSRGAILSFVLKILEGFNFSPQSMEGKERKQTYHRIIEALKFGNGQLTKVNSANMSLLLSEEFAVAARRRIDNKTHLPSYYSNDLRGQESYGTSHVSVVDREGNAVSVTSSINHIFGSLVYSSRTGIILNNQLADFCDSVTNTKKVAGQQPPSSMSPSILLSKDKGSMMVVGAAGGTMILSTTAQVIMNKLWFGLSLEEAIREPRTHVMVNNFVQFEEEFDKDVVEAMRQKGHHVSESMQLKPIVQGIFRDHNCIEAVSDQRKLGKAAGD